MARIRSVHPDICQSETMARLSAQLERTFVRLWTHCDDHGRCLDNPKLIKAALFPLVDEMTAEVIDRQLDELQAEGLIRRYEAEGKRCVAVHSWGEYQHPQRATPSKLPTPPETTQVVVVVAEPAGQTPSVSTQVSLMECSASAPRVLRAGVGEGEGDGGGDIAPLEASRKRDELWDALIRSCGIDSRGITKTARGGYNAALKALRDVGATPDELEERARAHRTAWPQIKLTPSSLAKHWGELDPARQVGPESEAVRSVRRMRQLEGR